MVEADVTLELLEALNEGADASRFEYLFSHGELGRVFPALGIPARVGLTGLLSAVQGHTPEPSDETGRGFHAYVQGLRTLGDNFHTLVEGFRSRETDIVAAAWSRAAAYLPPVEAPRHLRLVFLPLGLDFRTDRETVYMDPLAAVSLGLGGIEHTLAHELHHVGRYLLTGENPTLMEPPSPGRLRAVRDVLRDWASWLEVEGIADCASNVTQTDVPALHAIVERRHRQMESFATLLNGSLYRLARASAETPSDPGALEELGQGLRQLAHPIGARMAGAILSAEGLPSLVECVGRPRDFLQRYNEAALRTGGPGFEVQWLEAW